MKKTNRVMVTEPQVDPETGQEKLVKRYEHKIVREKIFLVPDPVETSDISDLGWEAIKLWRQTGIFMSSHDSIVKVRVDNWSRFGSFQESLGVDFKETQLEKTDSGRNIGYFAKFWPARIFNGHKEGDIITLTSPEYHTTYELQLSQLQSAYGKVSGTVIDDENGIGIISHKNPFTFEQMLDYVTAREEESMHL
jgi:hypothetical protein